ncbi:MAG: hydroxyethylthiazole kinase [Clostridia bacterium]|nr:hydroxyethylthiazole kinase [Clostridia bacterium]
MLAKMLENVRNTTPLVHNITNYVTVNDCANALLACGGSPIMADDVEDAKDITAICTSLNINIGTLNKNTIPAMLEAGKIADSLGHPIILDPVGAGASKLRTETAKTLIENIHFSVIRGNISEIKALALGEGNTKGVDADVADAVTEETLPNVVKFAKDFSDKTGAVIAITGAIDIIADSNKAYLIRNGHPMMSKITGTGCMLSAITGAYIGANQENILEATAAAVCVMGLCGERAYKRLNANDGNSTYRNYIIDEIYNLNGEKLKEGAKFEIV